MKIRSLGSQGKICSMEETEKCVQCNVKPPIEIGSSFKSDILHFHPNPGILTQCFSKGETVIYITKVVT